MEAWGNLNEVEEKLLEKNILEIVGQINEEMIMKIREAISILEVGGSLDAEIRIMSEGGDVGPALAIYGMLKKYSGEKKCEIFYECNSACLIVLAACSKRKIDSSATLGIHGVRSVVQAWQWEDEEEIKNLREEDRRLQERFYEILILSSRSKLSLDKIKKLTREEKELSSDEALKFGLVDEIME